ncbi:uncharacterized protein LOC118407864 [Branchiostoma floridae]|uniref:Uncharacterized protein LOC118407864 n=1 Tax=Branchiostoma floridae TaxID=7739 RepID=A0A9J7KBM1_BRAFL|nr:uncharacterized protein LOC118407864 [Branchiostoma floridae]
MNQGKAGIDRENGQQPTDEEKDTRLPHKMQRGPSDMQNNPTYASAAQDEGKDSPMVTSCCMAFLRSRLLRGVIVAVAGFAVVAIGFLTVAYLTLIPETENDAEPSLHLTSKTSPSDPPAWMWTTSITAPYSLTNVTATLPEDTTTPQEVTNSPGVPTTTPKIASAAADAGERDTSTSFSSAATSLRTSENALETEKQAKLATKEETAFACWKASLHLSCPSGKTLTIDYANWGRTTSTHFCTCFTCDINCRAANSLSIMRGVCEGEQQCTVTASDHVFGDPCPGTQKYLETTYRCVSVTPVTDDELGVLVTKYAPKVWLAKNEKYNPSSVDFHLQNVKVYDGGKSYFSTPSTLPTCSETCYMSTAQPLRYPDSQLRFFGGEQVGPTYQPPVYAVVKRIDPTTTDIFYWMFYSYNGPKKVCMGFRFFGKCAGGLKSFSHHVGDWEHMTIRLVGKQPRSIYVYSAHKSGGIYDWDPASQTYRRGKDTVQTEGTHPVLYAAHGSHKLWSTPGTHTYRTIIINENLSDKTSAGTAWDTWKNVPFTMYRPDGGYTGSWSWLNYQGRWGNRKVSNVPFTMYRPDGGYTGSWSWLNYQGRWGNRKVSNVPFTMYRPDGGYTGSWSWLNYQGRWGNRKVSNVPFTMYRPDGGYTGSWSWLNYQGRWGNRKVSNVPFTMYRPDGGYTGSWSWLNYQGRWGNRKVSNVPFTMYRPDGGYTGSWSWLNYQGRWGNRKVSNVPFTMYRPDGGYTGSWSWLNYQGRWGNRKVSNVPFTMYRPDGGYTGSWSWLNYQGRWGNRKLPK